MRQVVYTMFVSNNRASFHLWGKENLVKNQNQESQNIMKMIAVIQMPFKKVLEDGRHPWNQLRLKLMATFYGRAFTILQL